MTDIFLGFIGFVHGSIEDVPAIEASLGAAGQALNFIKMAFDYAAAANFIVPVPDVFAVLSAIFVLKAAHLLLFVSNWIVRRIFDIIP